MWILRSAYTEQTATVKKLLEEGFEPFQVIKLTDAGKTKFRVYFKRLEGSVIQAELIEASQPNFDEFLSELKRSASLTLEFFQQETIRFLDSLHDELSVLIGQGESNRVKINRFYELVSGKVDVEEDVGTDTEHMDFEQNSEYKEYKVIDDIPPEAQPKTTRTEAQERTIEQIKAGEGNITVFSPNGKGIVRILAGAGVYLVFPNGDFKHFETGAGTSSIVVGE